MGSLPTLSIFEAEIAPFLVEEPSMLHQELQNLAGHAHALHHTITSLNGKLLHEKNVVTQEAVERRGALNILPRNPASKTSLPDHVLDQTPDVLEQISAAFLSSVKDAQQKMIGLSHDNEEHQRQIAAFLQDIPTAPALYAAFNSSANESVATSEFQRIHEKLSANEEMGFKIESLSRSIASLKGQIKPLFGAKEKQRTPAEILSGIAQILEWNSSNPKAAPTLKAFIVHYPIFAALPSTNLHMSDILLELQGMQETATRIQNILTTHENLKAPQTAASLATIEQYFAPINGVTPCEPIAAPTLPSSRGTPTNGSGAATLSL